jgi:peroxiredoxin
MPDPDTTTILPAGTPAPDFALPSSNDTNISLSQYKGQPVVLVFYPGDWSPVCTDQLTLYNQVMPAFKKYNAQLLGISVDSIWSHQAWVKTKNLHFPLLADFEPKGKVSKMYGAYMEDKGTSARSLFVVDPAGVIAWSYLSPPLVNPGADGILAALESLDKKK